MFVRSQNSGVRVQSSKDEHVQVCSMVVWVCLMFDKMMSQPNTFLEKYSFIFDILIKLYLYYVKVPKCRVIVTFYLPLWLNETHFPGSKPCSLLWGHFLPKKLFWILAYYVKEGEDLSHPLSFLCYGFPKDSSIRHTLHGIVRWYDGIPRPVAIGAIKDLGVNMYIDTGLLGTLYA